MKKITLSSLQLNSLDDAYDAIVSAVKTQFGVKDLSALSNAEKRAAIAMMIDLGIFSLRNVVPRLQRNLNVSREWIYRNFRKALQS